MNAKSCENVMAPDMISNTITEILALENIVSPKTLNVSRRFRAAKIRTEKAPVAAASLGVAIPKKMTPTTEKITNASGRILIAVADSFSERETFGTSNEGASSGCSRQRPRI